MVKKIKVIPKELAVIYGGISGEKAICELEGKLMIEFLKKNGHTIYPIKIDGTTNFFKRLTRSPKFAVLCLTEDLGIQWVLDMYGIFYQGSGPFTTMLSLDKILVKRIVSSLGFLTPKFQILNKSEKIKESGIRSGYPLVVKPSRSGSSHGLSFVTESYQLLPAFKKAFKDDTQIIVEEFIEGTEITIVGLTDKILGIVELDKKISVYNYNTKLRGHVDCIEPARISEKATQNIHTMVKHLVKTFGLRNIYRIDAIVRNDEVYFLEVNTLPFLAEGSECYEAVKNKGVSMYNFLKMVFKDALANKKKRVLD